MRVVKLGDERLRQKSAPVTDIGADTDRLVAGMLDLMRRHKGAGLAAVQAGVPLRLFVTAIDRDIPRVFINPSLIETSPQDIDAEEGCLSLPGVWGNVRRPFAVRLQAWDAKGKRFNMDADGILARVILHEYDHLEGRLFVDRMPDAKRERLLAKYERIRQSLSRGR